MKTLRTLCFVALILMLVVGMGLVSGEIMEVVLAFDQYHLYMTVIVVLAVLILTGGDEA